MTDNEPAVVDEGVLDDVDALVSLDPGAMLRALATSGAQVREAQRRTDEADLAGVVAEGRPRSLVVAGMGGSGVAADVVASVTGVACPIPVSAVRSYQLPGWVGPLDMVVAVSCSGSTEETLAVTDEALRRGARVVTVGRDGSPLAKRAELGRAVHLSVDAGGRMPRANLWALSVPVLMLVDALGLAEVDRETLTVVADDLDRISETCGPVVDSMDNPAKKIALALEGSLPYLWGTSPLAAVAAHRFACQLAENAKYPAVDGAVPEVHHNQIVVLAGPYGAGARQSADDLFRDRVEGGSEATRVRLVVLRDTDELEQVARRQVPTRRVADEYGVALDEIVATGTHPLARLASLVGLTDFASVYLALLQGTDPTPIQPIVWLKEHADR